jgi:hypothetical protein
MKGLGRRGCESSTHPANLESTSVAESSKIGRFYNGVGIHFGTSLAHRSVLLQLLRCLPCLIDTSAKPLQTLTPPFKRVLIDLV